MSTIQKPSLKEKYQTEIRQSLLSNLGKTNIMEVPKVSKIVVNMGVGEAVTRSAALEGAIEDLAVITGQRPMITRAKKSIAGFKLREGNAIGAKVTLRGDRMYEFLDRLVTIAIPRIRDFRGLNPKSFDKQGNYSMGISEQIIFPEINYDQIDTIRGMDITISTSARNPDEGRALLRAFKKISLSIENSILNFKEFFS